MSIKVKQPRKGTHKLWIGGTYCGIRVRETVDLFPGQEEDAKALILLKERTIDALIAAVAQREKDAAEGESDWRKKTFEDACDHYLNKGGSPKYLGQFCVETGRYTRGLLEHFEGVKLGRISEELVFRKIAVHWLRPDEIRASTKNRCFIVPLIAVFNATLGAVPPVRRLKEIKPETRSATPKEVSDSLAAYADLPHLRLLVMTLTVSGRRITELIKLPREAMAADGVLIIGKTKNGDPITIVLPLFLAAEILALPRFKNGRLFGYMTRHSIYDTMRARCSERGINYLPPHQIGRHTFAMTALKAGMDITEIQIAGGWKSLGALMRYLKLIPNNTQKKAANTVAASLGLGEEPDTTLTQPEGGGEKMRAIR